TMSRGDYGEMVRNLTTSDFIEREHAAGVRMGPFERSWLNERAPEKVRRYLELAALRPQLVGTRGYSMGMDVADVNPLAFTAVTASATETLFWQNPAVWTPIPAGDMRGGKAYKVSFGGIFTSTATQGLLT